MKKVDNFDVIKRLLKFEDKDDFYFLQIIQRKKDGNQIPSQNRNNGYRTIKSYYISSIEDLEKRREVIIQLCKQNHARAYINLNVRSAREVALEAIKNYSDLVKEGRSNQGFRVWDHVCGTSPKLGIKRKWIVDVDDLSSSEVRTVCEKINLCRSDFPMEWSEGIMYDNVVCCIETAHGCHIITHGFDLKKFREILEQTALSLTKEQIREIVDVKKDNPTLLYFSNES